MVYSWCQFAFIYFCFWFGLRFQFFNWFFFYEIVFFFLLIRRFRVFRLGLERFVFVFTLNFVDFVQQWGLGVFGKVGFDRGLFQVFQDWKQRVVVCLVRVDRGMWGFFLRNRRIYILSGVRLFNVQKDFFYQERFFFRFF